MTCQPYDPLITLDADGDIVSMKVDQMPDVKERLGYVLGMTRDAARHAMTLEENFVAVDGSVDLCAAESKGGYAGIFKGDKNNAGLGRIAAGPKESTAVHKEPAVVDSGLRDISAAKEYQDLAGQVVRRVIEPGRWIEDGLVDRLRVSGAIVHEANIRRPDTVPASITGQGGVDELLSTRGF